jgi:hypothetical protein
LLNNGDWETKLLFHIVFSSKDQCLWDPCLYVAARAPA